MMREHGIELDRIKTPYPEIQADSLEITIIPGLQWLVSKFDRPTMIDDSGLFVDALRGFPGVYSSYVFKTVGCDGILNLIRGVRERGAKFECCIGFMRPGHEPFIAKGVARGYISEQKMGTGGFGYDPIFLHEGYAKSYAQLDVREKNKISHRGRAMEVFLRELPGLLA